MNKYNQRTPAEIALTNFYIDKWDKILYSTQPIDRLKAEQAVFNAYQYLGLPAPKILFITSPSPAECEKLKAAFAKNYGCFLSLKSEHLTMWGGSIEEKESTNYPTLRTLLKNGSFGFHLRGELFSNFCHDLYEETVYSFDLPIGDFHKSLYGEMSATNTWFYDLCIEQGIVDSELTIWSVIKSLNIECPYLITYSEICFIIEKPCELHLNQLMRPHADGKAAIKYADGFEVCCYHGTEIPAKYGKIHSDNWQAQWILDERLISTNLDSELNYYNTIGASFRFGIGLKSFYKQLLSDLNTNRKNNLDEYWKTTEYPNYLLVMEYAYERVIFEWILLYYHEYYSGNLDFEWRHSESKLVSDLTAQSLHPSEELKLFDDIIFEGEHPFAPGVYIDRFILSQENISGLSHYPAVQLFRGDRDEIYYVIVTNLPETFSTLYCKLPDREPFIYAECLTSWIVAIAHCYQEGAYYLSIDPTTRQKQIEQDLDKVEQIFEKFNPQQIDGWRQVWRN